MIKGIAYARYSSERQTEQSIEGQLRACKEYADRHDIVLVDTYIDRAKTGTNDNRDNFQRMLKDSYKKVWDVILVYKLDRFSRNKYEMAIHKKTLKDNGIKLISVQENIPDGPEGIILESLLEGMAEYYSAELSQKVKRGMRESRIKGLFTGGSIIYGYKVVNKKVVIDDDKAEIVRFIYEQYANNVIVKDIIAKLTEKGILNRGKPFAKNTVHSLLKNEKYTGVYWSCGEKIEDTFPRIVPQELFDRVKYKIERNKRGFQNRNNGVLLRGKVICGYCGKNIIGESGTSMNGEIKRYYKCSGRKYGSGCNQKTIGKDMFEKVIIELIKKFFKNEENIKRFAYKIEELQKENKKQNAIIKILEDEKNKVHKSLENIIDAIEKGIISKTTQSRLFELEKMEEEIEQRLVLERKEKENFITNNEIIKFIKTNIEKEPKIMINALISKIVLFNDKIEIEFNYTNKIDPDFNRDLIFILGEEKIYIEHSKYGKWVKDKDKIKVEYIISIK